MQTKNGSGRLDRIEAALERDHEEFRRDHKHLMTWQMIMQDRFEKQADLQQAEAELVGATGKLMSHGGTE